MNTKYKVAMLVFVAFLIGDAQAIYRGNRKISRLHKKLHYVCNKHDGLLLRIIAFEESLSDIENGVPYEEAQEKYDNAVAFSHIVEQL